MRIISLVPSITETLFDLGLTSKEIVGRTKFCIHPHDKVNDVEIIGGTKNLSLDKIRILNPDLIIANKEENTKDQIEELMKTHKLIVTDISTLEDNYHHIKQLGELTNTEEKAQHYNLKIKEIFSNSRLKSTKKVAYLIWKKPFMTIGGDTFISNILSELGFENIFKNRNRYPEIKLEELESADYIFLSSEPFPFKEKHIKEISEICQNQKIIIVDGEAFSWYGTHIAKSENYYKNLLNEIETKRDE